MEQNELDIELFAKFKVFISQSSSLSSGTADKELIESDLKTEKKDKGRQSSLRSSLSFSKLSPTKGLNPSAFFVAQAKNRKSKPLISDKGFPYHPAELVIPAATSKDQKWHIKFYAWNRPLHILDKVRDYTCNNIKDHDERLKWCKREIKLLNKDLKAGFCIDPDAKKENEVTEKLTSSMQSISVIEALQYSLQFKKVKAEGTYKTYKRHAEAFIKWAGNNGYKGLLLSELTSDIYERFLLYKTLEDDIGPRTYNNYLEFNKTLIFDIMRRFNKPAKDIYILKENPLVGIATLECGTGKNIAFNKDQVKELLKFMNGSSKRTALKFACQWMYYTLNRTNEMVQLQVKHLYYHSDDKIYLPKEICKNKIERHVSICPELQRLIEEHELLSYPPDHYIFSAGSYLPGHEMANPLYLARSFSGNILNKCQMTVPYTFYSWKHTGVVALWNAGVPKGEIQVQAGWKDSQSFDNYLKSLGLMDSEKLKSKYPVLPSL